MGYYGYRTPTVRMMALFSIIVTPIALVIVAFSGCNLRRRADKSACRNGSADRCLAVGEFYEARAAGFIATLLSNATTAEDYYQRACKLGNVRGCARFGHMVAVVRDYDTLRDGDYTDEDGRSALQKACDGGVIDACHELVSFLDSKRAAALLMKLCDAGDKASCDQMIETAAANDPKAAVALAQKRCDAGDSEQCGKLGQLLLTGQDAIDADPSRGLALLTKACDAGEWRRCTDAGDALLDGTVPEDVARARALLGNACDHGDGDGCFSLGRSLIASDTAKAVQVFTSECKHHDERGCDAMGDLYRVGVAGIARSVDKAHDFYDTACQAGIMFSCNKAKCMDGDSDGCQRAWEEQKKRDYRLGGAFDIK